MLGNDCVLLNHFTLRIVHKFLVNQWVVPDTFFTWQFAIFKINVKYDSIQNDLVLNFQQNFCGDNMQTIEYIFILIRMPHPLITHLLNNVHYYGLTNKVLVQIIVKS
jgi:hypothetical protein